MPWPNIISVGMERDVATQVMCMYGWGSLPSRKAVRGVSSGKMVSIRQSVIHAVIPCGRLAMRGAALAVAFVLFITLLSVVVVVVISRGM